MSRFDADRLFRGGRVPEWLRRFEQSPLAALHDLLLGRAALGHLAAADPADLLLGWLRAFGDEAGFAGTVDGALAEWIGAHWGESLLPGGAGSAALTAEAWARAADLIAVEPALDGAAAALRVRLPHDPRYLNSLGEGRARDPQGRAWRALAYHQPDRGLLEAWWRLCRLPPEEPWYRGGYAIEGLLGLPPADPARGSGFSTEAAEGLARLAEALWRRQAEGWLEERVAREEFQRIARRTEAAMHFEERWQGFWRHVVVDPRRAHLKPWLVGLHPRLAGEVRHGKGVGQRYAVPDPAWALRAKGIAERLRRHDWGAVTEAEALLAEERRYAGQTGEAGPFVRGACWFASAARKGGRAELALRWAGAAKALDPWDSYAWTTEAACLLTLGRRGEALRVAGEAARRFPDNAVAGNTLAEVLKAAGRLEEAEGQYRRTLERHPENVVAHGGLAGVLAAAQRREEAVAEYRRTVTIDPRNEIARAALARLTGEPEWAVAEPPPPAVAPLRPATAYSAPAAAPAEPPAPLEGQRPVAGAVTGTGDSGQPFLYRIAEPPPPAAPAAASPLPTAERSGAAETAPPPPTRPPLDRDAIDLLAADAYLVRGWADATGQRLALLPPGTLRSRAGRLLEQLGRWSEADPSAAEEQALLELAEDDVEQALELLRRAVRRFPGSARVRYALARAERAAGLRSAAGWRRLAHLDGRLGPLASLGEGRLWLAVGGDDQEVEAAREALGRLGYWLHGRLDETGEEVDGFTRWWAQEVQRRLFGAATVAGYADLPPIEALRGQAGRAAVELDRLEEDFVGRFAWA